MVRYLTNFPQNSNTVDIRQVSAGMLWFMGTLIGLISGGSLYRFLIIVWPELQADPFVPACIQWQPRRLPVAGSRADASVVLKHPFRHYGGPAATHVSWIQPAGIFHDWGSTFPLLAYNYNTHLLSNQRIPLLCAWLFVTLPKFLHLSHNSLPITGKCTHIMY